MSEGIKYCPECGKQIGAGAVMCPSCGHMFNSARRGGGQIKDAGILKEGLLMIFIGLLIELASPVLGFFGNLGIAGAIGAFIGIGGLIVEIIGFAKIRHVNAHFSKAWNFYIGAIACSVGYAIATIVISVNAVGIALGGGVGGVIIAFLVISLGFVVATGILDILRVRELMNGCGEVCSESGDTILAEKCGFAGRLYMIARGLTLAINVLVVILTLAMYGSIAGGGYSSYLGILVAIAVFGVILIIVSCFLLGAQILNIVRVYQTYSKCSLAAGEGYRGGFSGNSSAGSASASSSGSSATEEGSTPAKSVHERVDELEKKLEKAEHSVETGAAAAGAATAGAVAASAGKTSGNTPNTAADVTEDPVTMLKRPDAEIEFIKGEAGEAEDDEKTVILEAVHPVLVRLSTGEKIEIGKNIFVLGRSREKAQYRVDNPAVSSRHVQLTNEDGGLFAEDLNSSNHTFINGTQLVSGAEGKTPLKDGDILKLAEEEFKVEVPAPAPSAHNKEPVRSCFRVILNNTGEEKEIEKCELTLGRAGGAADIKLTNDKTVGRIHARLRADEEKGLLFVRDEDSANGTFINGKQLDKGEEAELKNGDELKLSDITVRIHI